MMEWVMHIDRPRVSPMHMPKWASRLSLKVLDIRIQHVQDISENDARAEGAHPEFELDVDAFLRDEHVDFAKASTYKLGYKHDWAERYETKPHLSWATNPIVWAVTFKRHRWYE